MFPRTFWIILVIIPVLTAIQAKSIFRNVTPDPCDFNENVANTECPSRAECHCYELEAFTFRSRKYQGSITRLEATSPCEHRVRRDIMSLTIEERLQYIYAVKTARSDPRYSKMFYDMGYFHTVNFCKELHCKVNLLPWHRWFILQYENLLREIVPNITLVYWDWTMVMVNPFDIDLWDDNDWSFGGNGNGINNTVITGPFKEPEWKMVPGIGRFSNLQFKRRFNYTYPGPGIPSALHLAILFKLKPDEAQEFMDVLLGWHNNIHGKTFGFVSTMSDEYSVWAPEFFPHHAFLDKCWTDWQEQGYDYQYLPFFTDQTKYMFGTHYLPIDFVDTKYQEGNVCVTYERSKQEWIHRWLRKLTLDQLRDIRGVTFPAFESEQVRLLLTNHSTYVDVSAEFNRKYRLRNPITLDELDGTDRERGFRIHDLIKMSAKNVN